MKDGKFELKDLTPDEKVGALAALLISKKLITGKELSTVLNEVLDDKNEKLQKEFDENPGYKFLFDMLNTK
ncbi:hypothetical protein [Siminovitchia fordii]|uniref:Uncharacterized protein n=1 Tax=Siminovitchia fordii TaxID=254759 RepID=A0ABQ4KBL4_9BACI|nr:hypothetical protein [Siminovitchia fordii]GIN22560.1 hypothetical protein J1TS3_36940 [Siminovitchia fordii]